MSETVEDPTVQIYRNLHHTGVTYSIRSRRTGLVIGHTETITLTNASLRVQPAGNAKVRREGRKNVHAYVQGTPCPTPDQQWRRATYNPYKHTSFVDAETQQPLTTATYVRIDGTGIHYVP